MYCVCHVIEASLASLPPTGLLLTTCWGWQGGQGRASELDSLSRTMACPALSDPPSNCSVLSLLLSLCELVPSASFSRSGSLSIAMSGYPSVRPLRVTLLALAEVFPAFPQCCPLLGWCISPGGTGHSAFMIKIAQIPGCCEIYVQELTRKSWFERLNQQ
ncbi:hypothetical protein B0I37DRAFT_383323 [Chaetomium sp. MPI-CAGE-AT-0009]|nr:hypothetical protein B0I37DRAFT_383323 [Chaetomium sp. MPI-CAGE-AT-0009]